MYRYPFGSYEKVSVFVSILSTANDPTFLVSPKERNDTSTFKINPNRLKTQVVAINPNRLQNAFTANFEHAFLY